MDGDFDGICVASQRFVNGVVQHFEHHVVQTGAVLGIANVHAGALAYCIQTLQDFNTVRAVFLFAHKTTLLSASASGAVAPLLKTVAVPA
ncbi:hypothetical protein D3C78_1813100 [compost metagenome]